MEVSIVPILYNMDAQHPRLLLIRYESSKKGQQAPPPQFGHLTEGDIMYSSSIEYLAT